MAQQVNTADGTITTPGAYAKFQVLQAISGQSITGVCVLMGEADSGPDYTLESDLGANFFGPTEGQLVVNKYGSGRIVDTFNAMTAPMNDPQIVGTFTGCIVVKTNPSTQASAVINNYAASAYGTLQAKLGGLGGDQISYLLTASPAEVVPTTGSFALLLPIDSTNISIRVNGGSANPLTFSALETPTSIVSALGGISGLSATGGADLLTLGSVTGTLSLTVVSGNQVTINYSTNWQGTVPVAGATLFLSASSVLASVHAVNAGSYIVTGASATSISATKLLDVTGAHNALTPPTSQTALNVVSTSVDLKCYSAVSISNSATNPIDGFGKSLEIDSLTSGTGFLPDICYVLSGTTPQAVTWISTSTAPALITSAEEYSVTLNESRQFDQVNNNITAGGNVLLKLGYNGTTATATVSATTLTLAFTGGSGSGSPIVLTLASYQTVSDLASYISSLAGWQAAPGTAVLGSQSPTTLDQGTFNCCNTFTGTTSTTQVLPGRIKQDAFDFYNTVLTDGILVKLAAQATAGLPAPITSLAFLGGGAKGATTDAIFLAALNKLKSVRCNFVIPLVSQDATLDIAAGLTDPSSSYTIAAVHQNTRSHILQMQTLKAGRDRQAGLSFRGTFANAMNTAANLNNAYCWCAFQDVKDTSVTTGSIVQFQPYVNAAIAAAAQSGAAYKGIFNKVININAAIQAAGDFNDQDPDQVDEALEAGLLIIQKQDDNSLRWVSDQTTYGRDNNFIWNSIQGVYSASRIKLTAKKLMQQAFVGQSLADVSSSTGLLALDQIMSQLRDLKLIAPSAGAPLGYNNPQVSINGPVMSVSFNAFEATLLYFVLINFTISQIQNSASG